ncbi:MAG: nuclear transport factor 2 family protein, partial [Candidatus Limnocylindria bacterium]
SGAANQLAAAARGRALRYLRRIGAVPKKVLEGLSPFGCEHAVSLLERNGASFEIVELNITAGEDVAFAWALLQCGTPEELKADPENRLRLTIGLRKQNGRWTVAHEHHSFPSKG